MTNYCALVRKLKPLMTAKSELVYCRFLRVKKFAVMASRVNSSAPRADIDTGVVTAESYGLFKELTTSPQSRMIADLLAEEYVFRQFF